MPSFPALSLRNEGAYLEHPSRKTQHVRGFDTDALYAALDAKRLKLGLSWAGVARELWEMDAALNEKRPNDHPFSASTIKNMKEKGRTSCQHALFMLRWLNQLPEHFLQNPPRNLAPIALPSALPGTRLRWNLKRLYECSDQKRLREHQSWSQLARLLGCKPNQLTGLRSAKYATNIELAMRIVQWSGRPSTDFMYLAKW